MTETLLQTKLHMPVTRRSLVPRAQLLARLNAGLNGRLTLVSAPAGYGKTTLIVDWSRQLPEAWQLAWFSLDDNDNELSRFFIYVIIALQRIDGRIGQAALEMLRSPQANNIQIVLTDLANTLAQSQQVTILTLDDYHRITNPAIHDGIIFLLENAPAHFHLLLISRADPPFSLVRLRARHQMSDIRQNDLRFSPSEATAFLNQLMALDLPETAVAALEKRTEGWVAGLQMAALSLQGQSDVDAFIRGFTSSHRYIFDYLVEEVLAQRPEGTREFLLQTAVLDRLCAPLCDAVLGITEPTDSPSQQILEQLESANLFLIPLDDERRWYRYHHLFADLLQQQFRREMPDLERVVYKRASKWFERAGYAEETIQYALASADFERATSLAAHYGESWLRRGELGKILMWTERLPTAWRYQNPQLILIHAWVLIFCGRANEVEATLTHLAPAFADQSIELLILRCNLADRQGQTAQAVAIAEEVEAKLETLESNTANRALRGLAAINLANIYRIQGDSMRAQKNYETAVTLNQEVGNLYPAMAAMRAWGEMLLEQARLHEAAAVFHEGIQTEGQWAKRLGIGDRKLAAVALLRLSLGRVYYEWNRLADAEAQLLDAVMLLTSINPRCQGLLALAKLRLAQTQAEVVPSILEQLEETGQIATTPRDRRVWYVAQATIKCALYRQQPSPDLRAAIEHSLSLLMALGLDPLYFVEITQPRILVTLDRPQEAVPLLEKLTTETESNERYGVWLSAAVLLCLAYQGVGEEQKALALLHEAVKRAATGNYIRLFLDEGEPIRRLLAESAQQENAPNYAVTLLTYFPPPSPPASDPLSPREREVLQLIAGGLTNQQIADKLVIAPSTAKRHVINIYNKLGINNRAEATARAYELGIVNLE